jgi:CheY-like chemotaxis protein
MMVLAMTSVLVVDDEPAICSLLQMVLEGEECTVEVARNGQEALRVAATFHPDVVVSDLLMPILDGHELYAALQADPRYCEIPIIFMSTERPIRVGPTEHPAAIIPKPFDLDAVISTVKSVAEGSR